MLVLAACLEVNLSSSAAGAPGWEKLYEPTAQGATLEAVWADETGWFAGGERLLVSGRDTMVLAYLSAKGNITGFSGAHRAHLFAVGSDELVLRFDGDHWVEEHFAAGPPPAERGRHTRDLLQFVNVLIVGVKRSTVAFGPWLVVLRHDDDGTWHHLPEVEREQALNLALHGPAFARPAGCVLASWYWLASDQAMFSCHDHRAFAYDAGQLSMLGKLSRRCVDVPDRKRIHGGVAYSICDGGIWRSTGGRWARLPGPEQTRDFAVTARCLYAVTPSAVWRHCQP